MLSNTADNELQTGNVCSQSMTLIATGGSLRRRTRGVMTLTILPINQQLFFLLVSGF